MSSLARQAAQAFRSGDYSQALNLYRELACLIGLDFFQANIELTIKRLERSNGNSLKGYTSALTRSSVKTLRPTLPVLPFEISAPSLPKRLTVASILDKFSHACFAPECDLIPITPSRWREELSGRKVDMILVESAWHGNDGAWQYRVAKYAAPPGNELSDLLKWARKEGIPTVFWNKEDPPNFERFIDRASEFDFIFTTDECCIERYENRVPASTHVGVLPFAAQPQIHNPRLEQQRISATSFAGTYYADDFEPRRQSMNMLLRVAARYGLDIFDRMHGATGKEKERFAFPHDLQPYIRGSLTYEEMLIAYRRYRVGLNVNSVSDSPTMFSRRVFELLACGTPVISTRSNGIDRIFAGIVPTIDSEVEAVRLLDALMLDSQHWLRTSVKGIRAVFKYHTYAHRLRAVAKTIGLQAPNEVVPAPVVVVLPRGDAIRFASSMSLQDQAGAELIVVGARYLDQAAQTHVNVLRSAGMDAKALPESNVATYVRHRHPGSPIAICDSRQYYGPSYLLDAAISMQGAPKRSASTMPPDLVAGHGKKADDFEAVSSVGMVTTRLHVGTLVAQQGSPLLSDVLACSKDKDILDTSNPNLLTRAAFDFTSRSALAIGQDVHMNDLQ